MLVTDNVDRVRRFGRRFTGDGRDVDLWEPSPLASAGRRLAVVGVLAAVIAPVVVPGMTSGLLDRFPWGGGGGGDGTGKGPPGPSVSLMAMLSGNLNNSRTFDMIKVTTDEPAPYYMRFGVADEVSGDGFHNRGLSGGPSATSDLQRLQQVPSGEGVARSQTYRATVEILSFQTAMLPIYLTPTRIRGVDNSWRYDPNAMVAYSGRPLAKGKKYTVDYVRTEFSPAALRSAGPLDGNDPIQRRYTPVPSNAIVHDIVTKEVADKTNNYDKVRALFDFLSVKNGFSYSTQTNAGTSGSAIADFLDPKNRKGFCEQYAAALAWMVRDAGIPARVAFGFTLGSQRQGSTTTLTNQNLHAWTEVYFKGYGWVPFDATPAIVGSTGSNWAPPNSINQGTQTNGPDDNLTPGRPGDPGSSTSPHDPFPAEGPGGPAGGIATRSSVFLTPVAYVLYGLLLLVLLVASPAVFRLLVRRSRRPDRLKVPVAVQPARVQVPGEPQVLVEEDPVIADGRARAHAAWDELIDTMVDYKIDVDDAETPRTTANRLVTSLVLRSQAADGAKLLGSAEERARYARRPLGTEGLADSLQAVRGAIAGQMSRRTRLRAVLLPPSILARWRLAVVVATSNAVNAIAARRDTIAENFSLRRALTAIFPRRPTAGRSGR